MGRKIRLLKIIAFVLIAIEIVLIGVFSAFYFNNVFDLRTNMPVEWVVLTAVIFVALDCLFIWISILLIASLRQKTDLHAADVIGNDIQEAYNFAQVGLAVTDDDNTILWTNDIFKDRHLEIIDENITEWQPALAALIDPANKSDTVIQVPTWRSHLSSFKSFPPLIVIKVPIEPLLVLSLTLDTEAIEGRASPRNPKDSI